MLEAGVPMVQGGVPGHMVPHTQYILTLEHIACQGLQEFGRPGGRDLLHLLSLETEGKLKAKATGLGRIGASSGNEEKHQTQILDCNSNARSLRNLLGTTTFDLL